MVIVDFVARKYRGFCFGQDNGAGSTIVQSHNGRRGPNQLKGEIVESDECENNGCGNSYGNNNIKDN